MYKVFIWLSTGKSLYYISTQPFSTTYKHYYKIISQGNGKLLAYTPCLNCHVHNKLTGLSWLYVGIGSLVYIINLLIAPVANVLMRLSSQGKELRIFEGSDFFQTWKLYGCGYRLSVRTQRARSQHQPKARGGVFAFLLSKFFERQRTLDRSQVGLLTFTTKLHDAFGFTSMKLFWRSTWCRVPTREHRLFIFCWF